MGELENKDTIERLLKTITTQDFETARACYHNDAVQEWPQSGERLVGVDNIMGVNENYPGLPSLGANRVLAAGDLVVAEMELDYSGTPFHAVGIYEMEDGKVKRERGYFAEPFEAPEWRAKWVEKM